ncbi:unnamed protein product [Withania somnifera]
MMQGSRLRLKGWQQAAVALGSAVDALLDPRRADLIAEILLERPRVISTKVGHAWDLPDNTFGAAYAGFMGSRNFSPDDRPPVHDFWHTLSVLPTNLIGETALKVIEFEQMLLPMCLIDKQRSVFYQHYFPWALKAGYEKYFHEDLEDVHRKWGIIPAPPPPRPNALN